MTTTKTMTTADLASALDTDPRTLRKFLRSDASPVESVGKGKRYSLPATKAAITDFGKKFNAWKDSQAERKAARDAELAVEADDALEADDDAPEAPEEPTDADLDALEIDDTDAATDADA